MSNLGYAHRPRSDRGNMSESSKGPLGQLLDVCHGVTARSQDVNKPGASSSTLQLYSLKVPLQPKDGIDGVESL